jgi:hypothetical protein
MAANDKDDVRVVEVVVEVEDSILKIKVFILFIIYTLLTTFFEQLCVA